MPEWNAETAEWYADKYGEYATNRLAIDALELADDEVVVDIGCGAGAALRRAAPRVQAGQLIGVDPVPRMLEIARERAAGLSDGHRIQFRLGPAEQIPVDDNEATLVLAFDSYDHWIDREAGLREVARILRSDGRFVMVKDSGVASEDGAEPSMMKLLRTAGFKLAGEMALADGDVRCSAWTFVPHAD